MKIIGLVCLTLFFVSCDTNKLSETPMQQFVGTWVAKDRPLIDGVQFEIAEKDGALEGRILRLNDNKLVDLFSSEGDVLISEITRKSNFQFTVKEKHVAASLFSTYDLPSSEELTAEFHGKNEIWLGKNGIDGKYVRAAKSQR